MPDFIINIFGGWLASMLKQYIGDLIEIGKGMLHSRQQRKEMELNIEFVRENNRSLELQGKVASDTKIELSNQSLVEEQHRASLEHSKRMSQDWYGDRAILLLLEYISKNNIIKGIILFMMTLSYSIYHLTIPILSIILAFQIDTPTEVISIFEILLGYWLGSTNNGKKKS